MEELHVAEKERLHRDSHIGYVSMAGPMFSPTFIFFIECGPGKSCSKVTFLQNQERVLSYCLPLHTEREQAPFHGSAQLYGLPRGWGSLPSTVCSIFLQCLCIKDVTSPYTRFSLAMTLLLRQLLPGGGHPPPQGLHLTLGVPPDYFHRSTYTLELF